MTKQFLFLFLALSCSPALFALDSSAIKNTGDGPAAKQYTNPTEAIAHVPPFITDTRTDKLMFYPCTNCHTEGVIAPNPTVRQLKDMHTEIHLQHGKGRFWCLTCHGEKDRNHLTSLKKQPISFNQPHLLCGQCHAARQKDFFFGAHGKRKGSWKGVKRLTNCTECHNPHAPAILPRLPRSKPVARKGMKITPSSPHGTPPIWETYQGHSSSKPRKEQK